MRLTERLLRHLETILKSPGCKKIPVRIDSEDDAVTVASNLDHRITPIFTLSCVTGKNLDLILKFLHVLPPQKTHAERECLSLDHTEFQIDELFSVPQVGTVVGGVIRRGSIREGEKLLLGPNDHGHFQEVKVRTVHRHRLPCRLIQAGQAASVALMDVEREHLRKGECF
jgi:GTPase